MTKLLPSLAGQAYSINATRELALRALQRSVFDFSDGRAKDERTLIRNEEAFGNFSLLPEPLKGVAKLDLSTVLFGRTSSIRG